MHQSLITKYKQRLAELKASPKKSLGQNFLIDEGVIGKILLAAESFQIPNGIEIGPGLGALTESLQSIFQDFQVLELDREFAQMWRAQGLKVHEGDALKQDWHQLCSEGHNRVLVSNLPYQISSSIVIDRSLDPLSIVGCVLMFQKEVAERITEDEGSKQYGILSIIAQTFWRVQRVCDAGPGCFFPAPKVASRVLKFERRPELPDGLKTLDQRKRFLKFIKLCFQQRRKTLLKNLSAVIKDQAIQKEPLEQWLQERDYGTMVRPEQVSVKDYYSLFMFIY